MLALAETKITCPRCTGCLVVEWTFDREQNTDAIELLRCINCGWKGDPVMEANAAMEHQPEKQSWKKFRRKAHRRRWTT